MLLTVDLERLRVRQGERLLDAGCGAGEALIAHDADGIPIRFAATRQ